MSSIDMYLSSANSQATGVSALSNKHHNGYNQLEKSLQQFAGDSVLKSDSYDSAKAFYSAVLIPLAQGGILLTDAVEEACKKFPEQYTSEVDSSDLKSEELEKEIEEIENNITRVQSLQRELLNFPVPSPVKQVLMNQNRQSLIRDLEAKRKLEEKLQKLQAFHASSPTIFSEIDALKTTIDQGIAQADQSWNASTGQFTIPSGKNMDWANTIKNSWATRDKRLMEKQLKEYQIYAVIYSDKDGNPKIIWKVTKDGEGVKNPKIYQYLKANGKDLPSDLFEFMSQHDWDDKVKAAFRKGKDLQIGDKYHPALGTLVAAGQYLEDGYKFITEDELGQALQMLGFNLASYRLATNKGSKTVENRNANGPEPIKQTNDFATEPFLPESYYKNNYSSMDGVPNSRMEYNRLGSSGNVEKSVIIYDNQGKQSIRIDYSDHGNSSHHTNPHIHEYEWKNGYKQPSSHTKYFLDDNGVLRQGRIDQGTNSITFDFDK